MGKRLAARPRWYVEVSYLTNNGPSAILTKSEMGPFKTRQKATAFAKNLATTKPRGTFTDFVLVMRSPIEVPYPL
jgi:hypothetical protein